MVVVWRSGDQTIDLRVGVQFSVYSKDNFLSSSRCGINIEGVVCEMVFYSIRKMKTMMSGKWTMTRIKRYKASACRRGMATGSLPWIASHERMQTGWPHAGTYLVFLYCVCQRLVMVFVWPQSVRNRHRFLYGDRMQKMRDSALVYLELSTWDCFIWRWCRGNGQHPS